MSEMVERCVAFVTEQSGGEWDEKTIQQDAKKLVAFLSTERKAMQENCAKLADAIDSGRGNEKYIAAAIRALPQEGGER